MTAHNDSIEARVSRREFVAGTAAMLTSAMLFGTAACRSDPPPRGWRLDEVGAKGRALTPEERETLAAAQDRLLPSAPGSPGARDVNAIGYLSVMVVEVMSPDEHVTTVSGAARLEELAREQGDTGFAHLSEEVRDEIVGVLHEETDGEWTSVVLRSTLEAFLGDPVYGVNTNEAGWDWLGVVPGHPRPPVAEEPRRR